MMTATEQLGVWEERWGPMDRGGKKDNVRSKDCSVTVWWHEWDRPGILVIGVTGWPRGKVSASGSPGSAARLQTAWAVESVLAGLEAWVADAGVGLQVGTGAKTPARKRYDSAGRLSWSGWVIVPGTGLSGKLGLAG
jgi:hypothetical protein